MADTVLQAVISRFNASSARGMVTDKLFFGEMPAVDQIPYVMLAHDGGDEPDESFETDYFEIERFTFYVFGNNLPIVESIFMAVKTSFDLPGTTAANAALPVSGVTVQSCRRTGHSFGVKPERDKSDNLVYGAELSYAIKTKRTLGVN